MKVTIPRPGDGGSGVGKVYVLFDCKEACTAAKDALHGRLFDNRTVEGVYFDEGKFLAGDFTDAPAAAAAPAAVAPATMQF